MKFEMDLVRPLISFSDDEPDKDQARQLTRISSDALIHDAILRSDINTLAARSAQLMIAIATNLLRYKIDPDVSDFVYAAKELIEDARIVIDKGIQMNEKKDIAIGSVMIEIVVKGICSTLALPYDEVFSMVCDMNHKPLERPIVDMVKDMLLNRQPLSEEAQDALINDA